MKTGELSAQLVELVREHITSIEVLEVLLLLQRERERAFSADEVAAELRIQPRSAASRLAALHAAGFAWHTAAVDGAAGDRYRFNESSPRAAVVKELADAYQTRRVSLIELIFSRPPDNVRLFADAFVISPGKKRDG